MIRKKNCPTCASSIADCKCARGKTMKSTPNCCNKCKKKGKESCSCTETYQRVYPIDSEQGILWNETQIGTKYSNVTGSYVNYKIPFGWLDLSDNGRTGSCENNAGRMYKDAEGNKYLYKDFSTTSWNSQGVLMEVRDNRMPVEALSPVGRCEKTDLTEGCDSCPDGEGCAELALQTICIDNKCEVKWGPGFTALGKGCLSLDYDYKTNHLTGSVDFPVEGSDTIAIEDIEVVSTDDCPSDDEKCVQKRAKVLYQNTCAIDLDEDENGLKAILKYCESNTVKLECVTVAEDPCDGEADCLGLIAHIKVCDDSPLSITEDGICLAICENSPLKVVDNVTEETFTDEDGNTCTKTITTKELCLAVCEDSPLHVDENGDLCFCYDDETMCAYEDENGVFCLRPRIWTTDFFAEIADSPNNIAPSEQAAFPELDFTLYFDGFAGNPVDAPINSTVDGQCVTSIPGTFNFGEINQPPFDAPACMEWRMDLELQMVLSNPVPFPDGVVFEAPITIDVTPVVNGDVNGIAGLEYTSTGYLQPGYGLPLYNAKWQVNGLYPALNTGNTVGLEISYCFPENNPTWSDPTALCFGNSTYVVGKYYLVEKEDASCC